MFQAALLLALRTPNERKEWVAVADLADILTVNYISDLLPTQLKQLVYPTSLLDFPVQVSQKSVQEVLDCFLTKLSSLQVEVHFQQQPFQSERSLLQVAELGVVLYGKFIGLQPAGRSNVNSL